MVEMSVITSTWNLALLSRLCLYSILTQPFPQDKYEIVFVDDGSRDENGIYTNRLTGHTYNFAQENQGLTVKGVVEEAQEQFPDATIRYFYRDAPGWKSPCFAWNIGIKQAKGDIILQVYSDHILVGPVLQKLYEPHLHEDNLYVWAHKIAFDSMFRAYQDNLTYEGRLKYYEAVKDQLGSEAGYGALPWCYSVKKKWIEQVGGYDEVIKGTPILSHVPCDTTFMTRLQRVGLKFVEVPDVFTAKQGHLYDEAEEHESIPGEEVRRKKVELDSHLVWENVKVWGRLRANVGHVWGEDYTTCIDRSY